MNRLTGLAVGVSKPKAFEYAGETYRFSELPQAEADVDRVHLRLKTIAELTGPPFDIERITGEAATRESILGAIRKRLSDLTQGGVFVFVLEGHGTEVPDLDGDETRLGHRDDQIFPTADKPILDDELWSIWATRPDVTLFAIADTCRAETISFKIAADLFTYRKLGAVVPSSATRNQPLEALVRMVITEQGPNVIQFAAASRGTDAYDIDLGGIQSGRFTRALLETSLEEENLRSYEAWFRAANEVVRKGAPGQHPVLYYMGPDPSAIRRRLFG